jgi:hypothetical protein
MIEINIQNQIRKELSNYGIVLRLNSGRYKTFDGRVISSGLPPGVSDLLFVGKNKIAFIEVKSERGPACPAGRYATNEQKNFTCLPTGRLIKCRNSGILPELHEVYVKPVK